MHFQIHKSDPKVFTKSLYLFFHFPFLFLSLNIFFIFKSLFVSLPLLLNLLSFSLSFSLSLYHFFFIPLYFTLSPVQSSARSLSLSKLSFPGLTKTTSKQHFDVFPCSLIIWEGKALYRGKVPYRLFSRQSAFWISWF